MPSKILAPLVLLALIGLAYSITQTRPDAAQGKPLARAPLMVDVETIKLQTFIPTIHSNGKLSASRDYAIYPLVSGQVTFVSPQLKVGQFLSEGELLLRLDDAEYQVALANAQAAVEQARASLAEEGARAEQARSDWKKQSGTTPSSFALREPQLAAAEAVLKRSQSELALAKLNLARTEIRAQFSARVSEVLVKAGAYVTPNTLLAQAYASDKAEVYLPVLSEDLRWLDLERGAGTSGGLNTLEILNPLTQPPQRWNAQWVRSGAALDTRTQQLQLIAEIHQPFTASSGLRPLIMGQFVTAQVQGNPVDDAIVVANETIYQGPDVFVVEDNRLVRKPVQIARREHAHSLVTEGIEPGDLLVTTLVGNLSSGTLVSVRSVDGQIVNADRSKSNEPESQP